MLVAERGLRNTRRNRRWAAFVRELAATCASQEEAESLAWKLVTTWEGTP